MRSRRLAVLVSWAGYWFVFGIVGVIYLRYLGERTVRSLGSVRSLAVLVVEQFEPLMTLVVLAVIGGRLFACRWERLAALERGESLSIRQMFRVAIGCPDNRSAPGKPWKLLQDLLVTQGVTLASVVATWAGAIIGATVLLG